MKKVFNPRPIVFVAAAQIAGIIFAAYSAALGAWAFIVPPFIITALSLVVFIVVKKHRILTGITFALCIIFSLTGAFVLKAKVDKTAALSKNFTPGEYVVTGIVEYSSYSRGAYNYRLSNCKLNGKPSGNVSVYGAETGVSVYDEVEFKCAVNRAEKYDGARYSSVALYGSSFVCYNATDIKITGYKNCIGYKFKKFTDEKFASLSRETRAVASALVRGDTMSLSGRTDLYRAAGIAHVFAVSGLHVGLLYGVISLLFSKIPLNRTIKAVFISVLLFGYSLVCGLTASSLRAAVTCSVFALAKSVGEKRDSLNSLAVASLSVLLINPADLLGVGFILSFSISLSLIILAPAVQKATKIKSTKLGGSIGVIVAAEVVTIPLCVKYFGSFPFVTAVCNFFLVPVVTVGYYALFFGIILSLVLPWNIAFFIADNLLVGTEFFVTRLAAVGLSITVFPLWLFPAYYIAAVTCSDLLNVNKKVKFVSAFAVVAVLIALTFISYANI